MTRRSHALVIAIVATGLAGCSIHAGESSLGFSLGHEADSRFEWSGQVADGGWLEIKGVSGEVNAFPASGNTIQVTAIRTGMRSDPNDVEIAVVEHGDGVTICAVYPSIDGQQNECAPGDGGRNRARRNDVKVAFDVQVPAGVRFAGRMVNGAIRADDLGADVRAQTVNGSVRVSTSHRASAKTVNGSIRVAFDGDTLAGDTSFETVNGSITLDVAESLDANLEARTSNGRIRTNVPVTTTRSTRRRVEGALGNGGPTLSLRTVNGSITVD